MAAFRRAMIYRITIVLLVTLFWIVFWYSRFSPGSSDLAARRKDPPRIRGNLLRNSSFSTFWEVENGQLADDLIQEVVEELEKSRDGTVSSSGEKERIPCPEAHGGATEKIQGFRSIGDSLHAFVLVSVSRFSLEEFTAVGLASVHLRSVAGDPIHSCAWVPKIGSSSSAASLAAANDSSVIWGNSWVRYVNESESSYDVAVVRCSFQEPVGANGEGGFLVLNVTARSSLSPLDGQLKIEQSYEPIFRELPDEISAIQFEGPFRFDYAYCSPPLTKNRNLSAMYVGEWLMYHRGLWNGSRVYYFLYDAGGIDAGVLEVLQPFINKNSLTLVDFREANNFGSSDSGHQLAINDCLQRSRFLANWAFFWDLDEYFQIVNSTVAASIPALLQSDEDSPWISLANLIWSRTYCTETSDEDEWAVERMRFRLRFPTCGDEQRAETCHGVEGQRKWIANPRKVLLGSIHRTLEPEWNGVILQASIARINHFHDLVAGDTANSSCWIVKELNQVDERSLVDGWWMKDESFALIARRQHKSNN